MLVLPEFYFQRTTETSLDGVMMLTDAEHIQIYDWPQQGYKWKVKQKSKLLKMPQLLLYYCRCTVKNKNV